MTASSSTPTRSGGDSGAASVSAGGAAAKKMNVVQLTFIVAVNMMAAIVYPINVALGANYMYLARRPMANNPFLIGPWPWYILGLEVACVLHLWVMDVLFRVRPYRVLNRRGSRNEQ